MNRSVLLSTKEAARLLNLSPRTLEAFRVRGGGPIFVKLGRRCFYKQSDLYEWIEANRRRSTSDPGLDSHLKEARI